MACNWKYKLITQLRQGHDHEAQPSQGTEWKVEEQTNDMMQRHNYNNRDDKQCHDTSS